MSLKDEQQLTEQIQKNFLFDLVHVLDCRRRAEDVTDGKGNHLATNKVTDRA